MATKKAAKKTASKSAGGKSMMRWDEEMAKQAKLAAAIEENVGAGGNFIGTAGGVFTYQGAEIPGDSMRVIIVDHVLENAMYGGRYDPSNPSPPVCFAFGRDEDEMAPHENSSEPQHPKCEGCPMNEFGSADTGRGKACKNIRRLALITEDSMEDIEDADIAYLKIPVTSVKAWAGYVRSLATTLNRPPFGVITEISIVPDAKTQFKLQFKLAEQIDDADLFEALMAKRAVVEQEIMFPYQPKSDEDERPARGKGVRRAGRNVPTSPQRKPAAAAQRPAPSSKAAQRPQGKPAAAAKAASKAPAKKAVGGKKKF